jgi:hypothetical protein
VEYLARVRETGNVSRILVRIPLTKLNFKEGKIDCYNIYILCNEIDCVSALAWNRVRRWALLLAVTTVRFESSQVRLGFLELLPVC